MVPFALVVARIAGLFVFTPLLANQSLPRRFRALLALMFGAAVYSGLKGAIQSTPDTTLAGLVSLVLGELLIGVVMGFIAGLPIIAMDMAGVVMGHQMGMGLGRVYNPDLGTDTDSIGQILMYVGLAVYVSLNGLDALFLALVSTFDRVPIGAFSAGAIPLDAIVGTLTSGTELALRVSAPVLCIILLLMIALGLISKTIPQVNIMTVGFTFKMFFGLVILAASMTAIQQATADEVDATLRGIVAWGQNLGGVQPEK